MLHHTHLVQTEQVDEHGLLAQDIHYHLKQNLLLYEYELKSEIVHEMKPHDTLHIHGKTWYLPQTMLQ